MGEQKYSSYARLTLRRWRRPARRFRLSPTRFSVRRLRAKLWTLLGLLGRNVRLLTRSLVAAGSRSAPVSSAGSGGNSKAAAPRRPPCVRSNSFYARAVAECLEFIKGSNAPTLPEASPLRAHGTPRRGGRYC